MSHYHEDNVEMEDDYDMDEPVDDMGEEEYHEPEARDSDSDEEDDEYGQAVCTVSLKTSRVVALLCLCSTILLIIINC